MRVDTKVCLYRQKTCSGTKMHINLDKRPDYFFLKGIFQGGAQWEQGGAKQNFKRAEYALPELNLQYAPVYL